MTNAQSVMGGMVWIIIAGLLMLGALRPEQDNGKAGAAIHQVASTSAADAAASA